MSVSRCDRCGTSGADEPFAGAGGPLELLCADCIAAAELALFGGIDPGGLLIDMRAAMKLAEMPIVPTIDPIAARGFLTILAGRHSSYKSWLMMLAGHQSHRGGGSVAGMRCEPTTVLYVDAENGPRLMGDRFRAAEIPADGLLVADGTKVRLPRDFDKLRALVETTGASLIVLDSLRRLAPGIRENESDDMAALMADVALIARDLDVAVVLIHHQSTKAGAATVRGSSAIEDQADLVFVLERVKGDRERDRRQLRAIKYRIGREPEPAWLRLAVDGNRVAIVGAEAFVSQRVDEDGGVGADEVLADRIETFADQAGQDGGWPPSRLSAAAGTAADSGTFKRALNILYWRGTWTASGKGPSRLLRPTESGQSGQALGSGPVGRVREGS